MTLSDLSSDCETCGTRATFTGNVKVEAGRRYAIVRCRSCKVNFPVFKAINASVMEGFLAGKDRLTDPLGFDTAWVVLRSGDRARVSRLLAFPVTELPLFGVEDVALDVKSVDAWVQLLLEWRGWVPAPDDATRLEEALAASIQYQSVTAAAAVTSRVGAWDSSAFTAAFGRLPARTGGENAGIISPVLVALRQRGAGWAHAAKLAATRWVNTPMASALVA